MDNFIIDVTESSFQSQVLEHKGLMVVQFWATWCVHCQHMRPIVEKVAKEYHSQVAFARVDIDQQNNLAQAFEVEGTPTFIMFKNGQLVDEKVGEMTKETFIHFLDENL
ncbi:thioredoxin [Zophobihabitans entericus]|uniref:Thioredoxin n=1 Tax=Zophobihabitans entericus TaxID=1635327 RepID=A0A6G9ICE7_9GAMM|nr:thioredoxin [Zophobihabitans entericus]QIQ21260.1 thioredoxin [Zophobihabitans entericus]